jgi:hypothetical protein
VSSRERSGPRAGVCLEAASSASARRWFVDRCWRTPPAGRPSRGRRVLRRHLELPIARPAEEAEEPNREALERPERSRGGAMSTIIAMGYRAGARHHLGSTRGPPSEIRLRPERAFTREKRGVRRSCWPASTVPRQVISTPPPPAAAGVREGASSAITRRVRRPADRARCSTSARPRRPWLDRASATASPTPPGSPTETSRARRRRCRPDVQHLQRAVELAAERGHPAARCVPSRSPPSGRRAWCRDDGSSTGPPPARAASAAP